MWSDLDTGIVCGMWLKEYDQWMQKISLMPERVLSKDEISRLEGDFRSYNTKILALQIAYRGRSVFATTVSADLTSMRRAAEKIKERNPGFSYNVILQESLKDF